MLRFLLILALVQSSLADTLVLKYAPKRIVSANYCLSSLFSEPALGCLPWNSYETASPLLTHGLLYIGGSDGYLHVVSSINGQIQKKIKLPGNLNTRATWLKPYLFLGTDQGHILSLDPKTGASQWSEKLDSELLNPIIAWQNKLYLVSGLSTLYAIQADTGDIIWEQKRPLGGSLPLRSRSNPLILEDKLIIGNSSGQLEWRKLSDGSLILQINLANPKKPFPDVATDPILIGSNQIAAASYNQGLSVVDAETGITAWNYPLSNITQLLATSNLIIAAGTREVTAIDLKTHELVWKFSFLKGSPTPLIAQNGYLYFGSDQGALYRLDIQTGQPWQILGSGLGFAGPFDFSENSLFAFSTTGYLYHYGRKQNSSCCGFN